MSDNFVIRTWSFCMNRFSVSLDKWEAFDKWEALCILMQYEIELM